ncbi:MAG: hypothetical protein GC179_00030 [Anaerolineaceae bacterium]|nr:hypothetical protein [Anaerolineaceae bacterium]
MIGRTYTLLCLFLLTIMTVGCSAGNANSIQRIALLAPFEGRYSEIGYDAYYSARLAIKEHGDDSIELLAIDDGGSSASAAERAKALSADPLVKVAIILGSHAAQPEAQKAFGELPVIIVGQWQAKPTSKNIYMLASNQLASVLTPFDHTLNVNEAAELQSPVVGGEVFALMQFPLLSKNTEKITIASSASLPDADFRQRYLSTGQYVPDPGLLATLSYDATTIAINALKSNTPNQQIALETYNGINGSIHFVDGYWVEAPINYYRYNSEGKLTPEDPPVK